MRLFFNNSFLLTIILVIIMIPKGISQTGTIIINKVTNPPTVAPEFNFTASPTLRINSLIVNTFVAGSAIFGSQLDQIGVTGTLQLVGNLGCDPGNFAGFIAGNIAVIDRGTCLFTEKVLNAQNAGASGVIIVNNIQGQGALGLGGTEPSINIPAISISYEDGLIVKSEIGLGLNATMLRVLDNFALKHGGTKIFNNVPAGYYAITEDFLELDGVELSDILISDPNGGSSSQFDFKRVFISLEAGETVEVTFISDITIVEDLISDIEELLQNGVINGGQANSLIVKLQNAKNRFDAGQINAALNLLNAFINQVTSFTQNGLLTPAQGQSLIDQANNLIALITGSLPKNYNADILKEFEMHQNYPNPFNPSTTISWQSPIDGWQTLKVYDLLGREIATLVDEYRSAESYEVIFDASHLSSGMYLYKLITGDFVSTRKMLLMK